MYKTSIFSWRHNFILISVIYFATVPSDTSARRSGGSGGGGFRSSGGGGVRTGGSFGRSSGGWGSSRYTSGTSGGGLFRRSSSDRTSATRYSSSAPSGGTRYGSNSGFGSSGATRYGTSSGAGLGARYGTSSGLGSSSATRYGSSSATGSRWGTSSSAGRVGGASPAGGTAGATRYSGGSHTGLGSNVGKVSSGTGGVRHTGTGTSGARYGGTSSTGGVFGSGTGSRWGSGGGTGTRWGSSGTSGRASPMDSVRNRFTGGGAGVARTPSAGVARSSYAGLGSSRAMGSRPRVQAPAARSSPTTVIYSPKYNSYHTSYGGSSGFGGGYGGYGRRGYGTGSLIATGVAAGVGGYALGRMMGGLSRPWGYYGGYGYGYGGYYSPYYGGYGYPAMGCGLLGCSPFMSYVPYRDRYIEYIQVPAATPAGAPQPSDGVNYNNNVNNNINNNNVNNNVQGSGGRVGSPTPAPEQKNIDVCMLARWNREIPFAELPNMALEFLANNNISGNSTSDKAKFVYEFFSASVEAYDQYNSSADIFTVPANFDISRCNFQVSKNALVNNANAVANEEPITTSLRHMLSLYSNKSADQDDIRAVVEAAKACLPQGPNVTHPEVIPCLDFSLTPDQLVKLEEPHSIFGSSEICRRQLSPDMFKCTPKGQGSPCRMEHLATLNLFARNFYLCSEALDSNTLKTLQDSSNKNSVQGASAGFTTHRPTTTKKPGFWSNLKSWFSG